MNAEGSPMRALGAPHHREAKAGGASRGCRKKKTAALRASVALALAVAPAMREHARRAREDA